MGFTDDGLLFDVVPSDTTDLDETDRLALPREDEEDEEGLETEYRDLDLPRGEEEEDLETEDRDLHPRGEEEDLETEDRDLHLPRGEEEEDLETEDYSMPRGEIDSESKLALPREDEEDD